MPHKNGSLPKEHSSFSIRNFPFYYGWIILFVGSLGVLASVPGQTMGVSVFTDFYIQNLQISRVQISTAYMIGTLASSFITQIPAQVVTRISKKNIYSLIISF